MGADTCLYKGVTVLLLSRPLLSLLFSSYEEFIRQTEDLNSMDCYKQLTFRAKHIGYHITKVVYRGYEASRALQNTHAAAVRTRMKLKLDAESEEQEQTIMEFKLKREKERTKLSECGCVVMGGVIGDRL